MSLWQRIKTYLQTYRQQRRSNRTVRYMFPAILSSAAAFSLLALSGSTDQSFIYLETPTQAVEVGDIFPVTVYASAGVPVNAVELQLEFPEDKVDVFGVDRGQSVITIWTDEPVIANDSVQLSGGTYRRGFLGDHQIATINFRATETGQYEIVIEDARFVAGDGQGTVVATTNVPATDITVFNYDENTTEDELMVVVDKGLITDINGDGKITLKDISAFMGAWSSKSAKHDFNGDGRMTFRDFSIILADFFFQ